MEEHTPKKSSLWKNLLLLLVVSLICLLLLEGALRLAGIGKANPLQEEKFVTQHSTYNPFLIFGPNTLTRKEQANGEFATWNEQGFRQEEPVEAQKKDGEYRIFALGGSTTENHPNGENIHYPGVTAENINTKGDLPVEVSYINSGNSGYTTAHTLVRFQFDVLPLKPDMITVMHNYNDLTVNYYTNTPVASNYSNKYLTADFTSKPSTNLKDSFLRQSRVLVSVFRLKENIRKALFQKKVQTSQGEVTIPEVSFTGEALPLEALDSFKNNLISLAAVAKEHDIELVFLTQPATFDENHILTSLSTNNVDYTSLEQVVDDFNTYNETVREVAEITGSHLIDMHTLLGNDTEHFIDMIHYSADGIRRFGELLSAELEKIIYNDTRHRL